MLLEPSDQLVAASMSSTKIREVTGGEDRVSSGHERLVATEDEIDGELVIVRRVGIGDLRVQPGRVPGTFRHDTIGDLPHHREHTRRASLHRAKLGERLAGLVLGQQDLDEEQVFSRVEEFMAELLPERPLADARSSPQCSTVGASRKICSAHVAAALSSASRIACP